MPEKIIPSIGIIGTTTTTKKVINSLAENNYGIRSVVCLDDSISHKKSLNADLCDICRMHDIYMMKVVDINARQVVEELGAQNLDLIIECGWSQIISKDIIQIP